MSGKSSRSAEKYPSWAVELAAQLRARRKALDLTQHQLADLAGCGPDFLYDLERGKPSVRLDKLMPVIEALGLRLVLQPHADRFTTDPGAWIEES
jgi:y4mF family transcriptional regulator